jgi:metal transporter CNNM
LTIFLPFLDVIEEIISEEIVDETDRYEDNQSKKRAKRITTAAIMRGSVALYCIAHFWCLYFYCAIFTSIVERERHGSNVSAERTPLLSTTPLFTTPLMKNGVDPKGSQYGSVISERAL